MNLSNLKPPFADYSSSIADLDWQRICQDTGLEIGTIKQLAKILGRSKSIISCVGQWD